MDYPDLTSKYLSLKKQLFDAYYCRLNDCQREAVYTVNGPLLVLAGAGSGKTTVLVNRVSHIIKYGDAVADMSVPDDLCEATISKLESALSAPVEELEGFLSEFIHEPCPPYRLLAITFTNKAAGEIKERLSGVLGESSDEIWAGTFHSICVRLLRRFCESAGYKPGFTIFDSDDTKRLISACMQELRIDEKGCPLKTVMQTISSAKDQLLDPEHFFESSQQDFRSKNIFNIYTLYQRRMAESNVLDFDDIIMKTVELLQRDEAARDWVQGRFKYVCVDEFQDTSRAQFELVLLLSGKYNNLMVVGDDDQSIYKFRGASVENILSFDRKLENTKVIKLEQNYRSTSSILNAANSIIRNNFGRRGKELWTARPNGDRVVVKRVDNQLDEARFIINKITELVIREKRKFGDFAILYRTNAQSNALEQMFVRSGLSYRIVGGVRFYERKEIKDILSYLSVINNPDDNLRLRRIVNEPKRKIGETTVNAMWLISEQTSVPMFKIMEDSDKYALICKSAYRLKDFTAMINSLREISLTEPLSAIVDKTITATGYRQMLESLGEEGKDRLENVQELVSNAIQYEETHENPTLSSFLEEISLASDIDSYNSTSDAVVMMTIHSSKGLEFPVVFLPGFEEGLFPGMQSVMHPEELEEERRLAYVAVTRAKDKLFCVHARERMIYGSTSYNKRSRFIDEIDREYLDIQEPEKQKSSDREENDWHTTKSKKTVISNEFYKKPAAAGVGKTTGYERFSAGDRVTHLTFGSGIIISATETGADVMYEIMFDDFGTKKLMATYAKLKRI